MPTPQATHHHEAPERHRDPVGPVGVIVVASLAAATFWVLDGDRVAEVVTESTSIPGWVVELGPGVILAAAVATLVPVLVMRRRAARWDAAVARTHLHAGRLEASEERNRLQAIALSSTTNAVVIAGADGTILWVNEAFETMSGYPSSVAIGATPRLLSSGLQDHGFYRELWETILAGQVWQGQVVNRRSDGELYTVSQTITPVIAESGEVQHYVAIHEDITERVRMAGESDASRMRLQALFEHALDAIALADDQGRYTAVNPAVCELTGYSRAELLGMGPADLAGPDQRPADVAEQFEEFVRAGTESGTFALRHKDGHVVETEYRAVANIQPGVHLSVFRDVTERNTMVRALTAAEADFRELAENAADIVAKLRIDRDGRTRIDYVNPAATTILGYPLDVLSSDPDVLLELFQELDHALDLLPTPAEPIRLATVQARRADGHLVWLESHAKLTDPATAPATIQLVARDVTARHETMHALEQAVHDQVGAAEQLRTLNAMKDTFLQSVSHELRTPLTSILGFAELLADPRQGLAPGKAEEFPKRILKNAQRLQRLLDDLLDVDRFARGDIEPNRFPADLTRLIERMVHDIELGDHTVHLDLEAITMDLDAPWVERIVANLLRNIVRHTPPDTRIWIQTRATAAGVELTVDDDGPGIPQADRHRLIEPFQQGTETTSSPQPGTGVGLSLVNAFAQIHGGELTITDSPAGGARMTVTLAHTNPANPQAATGLSGDGD